VILNTARFTKIIEEHARRYPDQWLWVHKRWQTRPEGDPDLYDRRTRRSDRESSFKVEAQA
jgi:KDO2-lipid IV(A) lauroyltransferase